MNRLLMFFLFPFATLHAGLDIVIPCIEKDVEILPYVIDGAIENLEDVENIYLVSPTNFIDHPKVIWIDEGSFPFSKEEVARALAKSDSSYQKLLSPGGRVGWFLQQLIKLYAAFVIPDLKSDFLILDADTVFINPVSFYNAEGETLYATSVEKHLPYFEHMKRLHPSFKRFYPKMSGIVHHMLFQKPILKDLFQLVESYHNKPFWEAFCHSVTPGQEHLSGASEYEIYFNFIFSREYPVKIRPLKWSNVTHLRDLEVWKKKGLHFVSSHHHCREDK